MNKKLLVSSVVIAVIIGIYFGATFFLESKARGELDKMVRASGGDIKYDNVSINLLASTLTVNKVVFGDHNISKVVVNDIYYFDYNKKTIPEHLNVEFKDVSLDTDKLNYNIKREIQILGYSGIIKMDLGVNYTYQKEKASFLLENVSVDFKDMYKVDFRADIENIKLDLDNPGSMMQVLFKYPEYKISFSELLYSDNSFMRKSLEAQAKHSNLTYEKQKENFENILNKQIEKSSDQSVKDFYKGVGKIMFEPGDYAIRISPDKPVAIKEIMNMRNPETVIRELNITIQ